MKIPKRQEPLLEDGLIDSVIRQLMSGKEAMVFVVRCGDEVRWPRSTRKPTSEASVRASITPKTAR
jgi:RIO kinase 1